MAGADKFGNVFLTRMPADISLQVEDDPTGGKFAATGGLLNAADNKVNSIINFHVGDLVMAMQLTALQAGGQEVRLLECSMHASHYPAVQVPRSHAPCSRCVQCLEVHLHAHRLSSLSLMALFSARSCMQMIIYGTISGAIGVFLPFITASDLDIFSQIEMHMRQLAPSLVGRDHLAFRGAFFPVKDVVDGDLCEQFVALTAEKQRNISEETDRSVGQLLKYLEDMRNKVL
jgi:splicing factor 3B subunit 3